MIDTPTHKNIADFKQRYQGVFGWLNPEKPESRTAVYVSNVSASRVTFRDKAQNEYYANVNTGVQFEFLPTQKAWYNTPGHVYFVQRIPARQWKRGVCPDNTAIGELMVGQIHGNPLDEEWSAAAFNVMSSTVQYTEAVADFLKGGRSSVALSKHFAISKGNFFFFNLLAGKFDMTTKTIRISEDLQMIRQELQDLINRNSYSLKVA